VSVHVGNEAFVDAVFGNDGTAQVQNLSLPFLTITAAINAVQTAIITGGVTSNWVIQVGPGTFVENLNIPGFASGPTAGSSINIAGQGIATSLLGTVIINGSTELQQFSVLNFSTGNPAVTVITGGSANLVLMNMISAFTAPQALVRGLYLEVGSEANLTRCGNFATVSAAVNEAYLCQTFGELNIQLDQDEFDVLVAPAVKAVMYNAVGPVPNANKIQMSQNVAKMTSINASPINALFEVDGGASTVCASTRLNLDLTGAPIVGNQNILAIATGPSIIDITTSRVEIDGFNAGSFVAALGDPVAAPNNPSVQILSNAFTSSNMGAVLGNFSLISWGVTTQDGTYNTNGGFSDDLVITSLPYTAKYSDRSILVNAVGANITLPNPVFDYNILNQKGQDLFITNYAGNTILVLGSFYLRPSVNSIALGRGQGVFLKNSPNGWIVMLVGSSQLCI